MDNKKQRIMKNRGRPPKSPSEISPTRKSRTIRLNDEEMAIISENASKCKKNFSEYCRDILMEYKPRIPDPELRNGLFAARKDMVNFINNIRGLNMTKEERSKFLASIPTIKMWWKAMISEIEWIDKYMERM